MYPLLHHISTKRGFTLDAANRAPLDFDRYAHISNRPFTPGAVFAASPRGSRVSGYILTADNCAFYCDVIKTAFNVNGLPRGKCSAAPCRVRCESPLSQRHAKGCIKVKALLPKSISEGTICGNVYVSFVKFTSENIIFFPPTIGPLKLSWATNFFNLGVQVATGGK